MTYRITPTTLTRARQQGWGTDALWEHLTRQIGSVPPEWTGLQRHRSPTMVTLDQPVLLRCDSPQHLQRLRQHGTIRRALGRQLALGLCRSTRPASPRCNGP
ncbi:MAG: hypothetical protein HC828_21295 [Blastochloris sp.]|nr:hypothetical protein [Blastochloris sp.]